MLQSLRIFCALLFFVAICCNSAAPARADGNSEMVVKAVMIRKFVEFIQWPEAVAPQKEMRVKVCIYGDTPMAQMGPVFAKNAGGSSVKYTLSSISSLGNAASDCHVLFVGGSQDQAASAIGALHKKPVLTVSDNAGFAEKGGMIGFQLIDGKVRYNINNKAFENAQLRVDAQLLEIANKVVE